MCSAVALPLNELPEELLPGLADRVHTRGSGKEVRFDYRAFPALLPVWLNGRLRVVRWGNRDRQERDLPPTGWTWRASVEEGKWAALAPETVLVPAAYALTNGVWYKVKEGVRGLVVRTRAGVPLVYLVTEPATRYFRVMTRCEWMPVLEGEVI